jgi:hypothetical protein
MVETAKRKWLAFDVYWGAVWQKQLLTEERLCSQVVGMETRILVERTSELP